MVHWSPDSGNCPKNGKEHLLPSYEYYSSTNAHHLSQTPSAEKKRFPGQQWFDFLPFHSPGVFDDTWVIDFSNSYAQVVLHRITKHIIFSTAVGNTTAPYSSQPSNDAYQHLKLMWGGRNQISIAFAQKPAAAVVKCTCTPFEMHPFLPKMSSGIIPILE